MTDFVLTHRLSSLRRHSDVNEAMDAVEQHVATVAQFAELTHDTHAEDARAPRRIVRFTADDEDVARAAATIDDVLIEPVVSRRTAGAMPGGPGFAPGVRHRAPQAGASHTFHVTVEGDSGEPIPNAELILLLQGAHGTTQSRATSGPDGAGQIPFDATLYRPTAVLAVPENSYWGWWVHGPRDGATLRVPLLPRTGPLGWWHHLLGMSEWDETRGAGISIGVVDTGIGPNAFVDNVNGVGSILGGVFTPGAAAAADSQEHGTHVSGIIAARPTPGSGQYGGIVPGAEVNMVRVFPPLADGGTANQVDIASALDELVVHQEVDLVNMSLGDREPSELELDALSFALERGALVFCAAGNGNGAPIMYPAAYGQAIAVAGLGLDQALVPGTVAAAGRPSGPGTSSFFGPDGIFVGNFNDIGPQMNCAAPGLGIISTVPASPGKPAPYKSLSGTSMATPMACAALASWLAGDDTYRCLPRSIERSTRAWRTFVAATSALPLRADLVGQGMPRLRP